MELVYLLLVVIIVLHILEMAIVGWLAAWSVQQVIARQVELEKEWRQVLQILSAVKRNDV